MENQCLYEKDLGFPLGAIRRAHRQSEFFGQLDNLRVTRCPLGDKAGEGSRGPELRVYEQECPTVWVVFDVQCNRQHIGIDQIAQRRSAPCGNRVHHLAAAQGNQIAVLVEHGIDDPGLVPEVVLRGIAVLLTSRAGDVEHRDIVDPVLGEQRLRRVDHVTAGGKGVLAGLSRGLGSVHGREASTGSR